MSSVQDRELVAARAALFLERGSQSAPNFWCFNSTKIYKKRVITKCLFWAIRPVAPFARFPPPALKSFRHPWATFMYIIPAGRWLDDTVNKGLLRISCKGWGWSFCWGGVPVSNKVSEGEGPNKTSLLKYFNEIPIYHFISQPHQLKKNLPKKAALPCPPFIHPSIHQHQKVIKTLFLAVNETSIIF